MTVPFIEVSTAVTLELVVSFTKSTSPHIHHLFTVTVDEPEAAVVSASVAPADKPRV